MVLTPVGTLWRRWIEVLTLVYFAWRDGRRARQPLMIGCENARFVVRKWQPDRDVPARQEGDVPEENVAVVAPGAQIPAKVARLARNGFIIFQLPADMVVVRRVAIPAQARAFLPGIIRNQLERLSPWHADKVVYGFAADADAEDATTLDVRVFVALRADVERARDELAAIGLAVDRIVTRQPPPARETVTLWSRLADISPQHLADACRRVGTGIAAAVVVSLGLTLWAMVSAASLGQESEEVVARIKTSQRQIQGPAQQSVGSLNPRERMWYAKETSPTAAIVLEALSQALPDGAYLTELRLDKETLRMIGLANDAPSLIAPLEHSGHLHDVHFFAPTARAPDGTRFRFNIEARVEPHSKMAEEKR